MSQTELCKKFDFLSNMYQQNPEAWEEYRSDIINQHIDSLPAERQQKVKQTQWLLDNDLRKFKDPAAKRNRMVELFWEQVEKFQQSTS